jgi:hypothetical protein
MRDNCLKLIAERVDLTPSTASRFRPETEMLSVWGYDWERRDIRVIAATFESSNPFWHASMQYGAGVRGMAMRRGLPEFWRLPSHKTIDYYHRCEGCEQETFLLAVPITVLPSRRSDASQQNQSDGDDSESRSAMAARLGLCWLVACLSSTHQESLLSRLLDPKIHGDVAAFLHASMVYAMKNFTREE